MMMGECSGHVETRCCCLCVWDCGLLRDAGAGQGSTTGCKVQNPQSREGLRNVMKILQLNLSVLFL